MHNASAVLGNESATHRCGVNHRVCGRRTQFNSYNKLIRPLLGADLFFVSCYGQWNTQWCGNLPIHEKGSVSVCLHSAAVLQSNDCQKKKCYAMVFLPATDEEWAILRQLLGLKAPSVLPVCGVSHKLPSCTRSGYQRIA